MCFATSPLINHPYFISSCLSACNLSIHWDNPGEPCTPLAFINASQAASHDQIRRNGIPYLLQKTQKVKVSRNREGPPKQQQQKNSLSHLHSNKVVHHGRPGEEGPILFLQQSLHFITLFIKYLCTGFSVCLCHGAVQMIQIHIDLFSGIWSSLWEFQRLPLFLFPSHLLFGWPHPPRPSHQNSVTNWWAMKGEWKLREKSTSAVLWKSRPRLSELSVDEED